jgi:hypothetical protein
MVDPTMDDNSRQSNRKAFVIIIVLVVVAVGAENQRRQDDDDSRLRQSTNQSSRYGSVDTYHWKTRRCRTFNGCEALLLRRVPQRRLTP